MIRAVLLDLAGVVYQGEEPLPDGVDAIARLRRAEFRLRFLTNTTPVMSKFDYNLYGPLAPENLKTAMLSYAQWQTAGMDQHSVVGDPGFRDPANGDFQLQNKDAAKKIGFRPFDVRDLGPRP